MPTEAVVDDGAPDDFGEYVAARGAALQRFAYLVSGDASEAADLVQEALERAWPRWRTLTGKGTHEAYVRRSIANGAVSRWRKLGRVRPVDSVPETASAPPADSDEAWALCATLPPVQRAAVVLRFYEELSYAEIGRVLDCAEATARSHVHRALTDLRARLSPGGGDE